MSVRDLVVNVSLWTTTHTVVEPPDSGSIIKEPAQQVWRWAPMKPHRFGLAMVKDSSSCKTPLTLTEVSLFFSSITHHFGCINKVFWNYPLNFNSFFFNKFKYKYGACFNDYRKKLWVYQNLHFLALKYWIGESFWYIEPKKREVIVKAHHWWNNRRKDTQNTPNSKPWCMVGCVQIRRMTQSWVHFPNSKWWLLYLSKVTSFLSFFYMSCSFNTFEEYFIKKPK